MLRNHVRKMQVFVYLFGFQALHKWEAVGSIYDCSHNITMSENFSDLSCILNCVCFKPISSDGKLMVYINIVIEFLYTCIKWLPTKWREFCLYLFECATSCIMCHRSQLLPKSSSSWSSLPVQAYGFNVHIFYITSGCTWSFCNIFRGYIITLLSRSCSNGIMEGMVFPAPVTQSRLNKLKWPPLYQLAIHTDLDWTVHGT